MQIKLREVCRYVVDKTQRVMQTKLRSMLIKLRQDVDKTERAKQTKRRDGLQIKLRWVC